ncbi:hypothetical protein [Streptomyces sp. NPDC003036]|uniref:hypothetical protein n=1 Tax=Streptomyces sp. NPDC003036 TaxID=3154442 RepID=UPI0033BE342B
MATATPSPPLVPPGVRAGSLLTPDRIGAEVVVDAVELLLDSWAALGATPG